MDLRQLQAFLAVVDHGSFTAAARATHTVQSNISSHVARLEKELGVVLIDRASGTPTPEGDSVLTRARAVARELASIEDDVAALRGAPRGPVRIGVIGTTARWLAPLLIDRVVTETPEIHLTVADGTTSTLVARLLDEELDLAIIGLPHDDAELVVSPLFTEDHLLVAPGDHPLAKATGDVGAVELSHHPILLAPPRTAFRREVDGWFRQAGVRPDVKAEIDGLRLLASLAFTGYAPAIVPATAAPGWVGGDWVRRTLDGIGRRRVGLARRRRHLPSLAARSVAAAVTATVQARGPEVAGVFAEESDTR